MKMCLHSNRILSIRKLDKKDDDICREAAALNNDSQFFVFPSGISQSPKVFWLLSQFVVRGSQGDKCLKLHGSLFKLAETSAELMSPCINYSGTAAYNLTQIYLLHKGLHFNDQTLNSKVIPQSRIWIDWFLHYRHLCHFLNCTTGIQVGPQCICSLWTF